MAEQILTPCYPRKSCVICESRMFPKGASPAKRAAKLAHQARWYGDMTKFAMEIGNATGAELAAQRAFGFARLALDTDPQVALSA